MNQSEAKRYAHRLVAGCLREFKPTEALMKSPDWIKIDLAMKEITEQHVRFGPKANDPDPKEPKTQDEPLPFDGELRL